MEPLHHIPLAICLLLALAYAQDTSTTATSPVPSEAPTSSGINYPSTPTDQANGDHNDNDNNGLGGLVNYYFVFFALLLCIVALGAFLFWRRKKRVGLRAPNGREGALQRDLDAWDPSRSRRRHWQGRWGSPEEQHVEGLNEHGEAPPPYMPKTRDEEAGVSSPAVPLHTLSREQAGLKPPEYMEANARPVDGAGGASSASAANGTQPGGYNMQWR